MTRTDQQIVDETNDLARYLLLNLIGTGYEAPDGHKFYEAGDSRSQKAWHHAVEIMELVTKTEVNDALTQVLAQTQAREYQAARNAKIDEKIAELQEIADGAWGDNPATRGAARDLIAALEAEKLSR